MDYAQSRFSARTGHCIQRPCMGQSFVFERPHAFIEIGTIAEIKSIPQAARTAICKVVVNDDLVKFESHLCLFRKEKVGSSYIVENDWRPTQDDLDADDWIVYNQ